MPCIGVLCTVVPLPPVWVETMKYLDRCDACVAFHLCSACVIVENRFESHINITIVIVIRQIMVINIHNFDTSNNSSNNNQINSDLNDLNSQQTDQPYFNYLGGYLPDGTPKHVDLGNRRLLDRRNHVETNGTWDKFY
jgi:hypothetical protein